MSEMRNMICERLARLAIVQQRRLSPDEIAVTADVWCEDLEASGERDVALVAAAIDHHRRNSNSWPTPATILPIIDKLRPARACAALPSAGSTGGGQTPGVGCLYRKFRREGRPAREFSSALSWLGRQHRDYKCAGRQWPLTGDDAECERALNDWFGSAAQPRVPHKKAV